MKNTETAKQIFKAAFVDYAENIIKKLKKETFSLDGASFFIKRKIGLSSGKEGFLTAHMFIDDINNPDIHSVTALVRKMTEYSWGFNSRTIIKTCLSNIMDHDYFNSVQTMGGPYDWMSCMHKVTHAELGVNDTNLAKRLIAEIEKARLEEAKRAADYEAWSELRSAIVIGR